MANADLRKTAKEKGVCLWQIASKLGITDSTFSRKLRAEMSPKEKEYIRSIIKELKENKLNEGE